MLTFETDGGFFSLINPSVRGAEPSPRPATPCPGREEASRLDSHISQSPARLASNSCARAAAVASHRGRGAEYQHAPWPTRPRRRSSRWQPPALGLPQACPCDPRARKWASWNVSAATASRRRPTTASPRRCRRSTSRRDLRVPQRFHAIDATRGRRTRPWAVSFPSLSLWKASGPSRDPTPPAGKRYKSPVAHVQEA